MMCNKRSDLQAHKIKGVGMLIHYISLLSACSNLQHHIDYIKASVCQLMYFIYVRNVEWKLLWSVFYTK